jgi:hypothetical protein
MKTYTVTMREGSSEYNLVFDCQAKDESEAMGLAASQFPGARILDVFIDNVR